MTLPRTPRRPGFSLLEVLIALAIFLLSIVAISQTIILANDQAIAAEYRARATQLAQSKLAEVVAGAVPLESQGETPFEEDESYVWSINCEQGSLAGLWTVQVQVSRRNGAGGVGEDCVLSQMVLDPFERGSTQDAVVVASSGVTDDGSTDSSSPGGSSQGGQSSSTSQGGSGSSPSSGGGSSGGGSSGGRPSGGGSSGGGSSGGRPSGGGSSGGGSSGGRPSGGGSSGGGFGGGSGGGSPLSPGGSSGGGGGFGGGSGGGSPLSPGGSSGGGSRR